MSALAAIISEEMRDAASTNGHSNRLTPAQVAALTRKPADKTAEERRENIRRATSGLEVRVRVTPTLYRPQ